MRPVIPPGNVRSRRVCSPATGARRQRAPRAPPSSCFVFPASAAPLPPHRCSVPAPAWRLLRPPGGRIEERQVAMPSEADFRKRSFAEQAHIQANKIDINFVRSSYNRSWLVADGMYACIIAGIKTQP